MLTLCAVRNSEISLADSLSIYFVNFKQKLNILNCYYDEKMLFLFSLDSNFIFCKNAPCQLLDLNLSLIILTAISRLNCLPLLDYVLKIIIFTVRAALFYLRHCLDNK